jgi:hypothetical protein
MKRKAFLSLPYLSTFTEPASIQLSAVQKLSQNAIVSGMNLKEKMER